MAHIFNRSSHPIYFRSCLRSKMGLHRKQFIYTTHFSPRTHSCFATPQMHLQYNTHTSSSCTLYYILYIRVDVTTHKEPVAWRTSDPAIGRPNTPLSTYSLDHFVFHTILTPTRRRRPTIHTQTLHLYIYTTTDVVVVVLPGRQAMRNVFCIIFLVI